MSKPGRPRKTYLQLCDEISKSTMKLDNGCIIWKGIKHPAGYGRINYQGRGWQAHALSLRLDYESRGIPIPDEKQVNHHCDTKACINPKHLYFGTHQENMKDCDSRGRRAMGDRSGRAKLNSENVQTIRDLFKNHHWNQSALAKRFGVSQSRISDAVNCKTWASVK